MANATNSTDSTLLEEIVDMHQLALAYEAAGRIDDASVVWAAALKLADDLLGVGENRSETEPMGDNV